MSTFRLRERLELAFPLLLAGMGGVAGPALVAAVAEAGCGGTLGLYKAPPARITTLIAETEALTRRSFGVNFVPEVLSEAALSVSIDAALGAARRLSFVSFFGLPPTPIARRLIDQDVPMIIQVGSFNEALRAVELGAAALIVQGIEAGGHLLGTDTVMALGAAVRERVDTPLIAAGGIGTGDDLLRFESAGFDGWCLGTRFIVATESNAHPVYKAAIIHARAVDTEMVQLFEIGWPRRRHRVTAVPRALKEKRLPSVAIGTTTIYGGRQPIFRYSAAVPTRETEGLIEEMALYCGTSCDAVVAEEPAAEIIQSIANDYRAARAAKEAR